MILIEQLLGKGLIKNIFFLFQLCESGEISEICLPSARNMTFLQRLLDYIT